MSRFPLSAGWPWIASMAMAFCSHGALAEPAPTSPAILSVLSELGLADARGAKWVRATPVHSYLEPELPGGDADREVSGNAWLVREEPPGRALLILHQSRLVHVRVVKDGMDDAAGAELAVIIQPADLKEDLGNVVRGLEKLAGEGLALRERSDPRSGASLGRALLLCAHLQQQGHPEAPALLAKLLAVDSPETTLDRAVNFLGDGRLADLNEQWQTGCAREAYAAGLEALARQFSRGWDSRGAALLLAGRVRASEDAARTAPAAELLRKLHPADESNLPLGVNWILPNGSGPESAGQTFRVVGGRVIRRDSRGGKTADSAALDAFFQQKTAAAHALISLLGSHEILRIMRGEDTNRSFFLSMQDRYSQEQRDRMAYGTMARPYEMGELATALLDSVNPTQEGRSSYGDETEPDPAPRVAWFATLQGKSEEEIAWQYLRAASTSNDENFRQALGFLIEHGSAATTADLREVFLDPAVWQNGAMGQLTPMLKTFVGKMGVEGEAFGTKLLEMLKTETVRAGRESEASGIDSADYRKQLAQQQAQQLKQLEQILRPRSLEVLLKEFAAARDEDGAVIFEAVKVAAGERLSSAVVAQIVMTAADSASVVARAQLLSLLILHGGVGVAPGQDAPPLLEASARPAALKLLEDARTQPDGSFGMAAESISEQTALWLLMPRLEQGTQMRWMKLAQSARSVSAQWADAAARDLLEGRPIPPLPVAVKMSEHELAELGRGWAGQSGAQVLAAVRAWPLGNQLGLIESLAAGGKWTEPLMQAQLTVVEVQLPAGEDAPEVAAWKGRSFDEKLRGEMIATLRTLAFGGKAVSISLSAAHPLSGLRLVVSPLVERFTRSVFDGLDFPGLQGRPPAEALLGSLASLASDPASETSAMWPQWKDATLTDAWRNENSQPGAPPKTAPSEREGPGSDPAKVAAILARIQAGEPAAIGSFQVSFYASPIVPDPKE